MTTPTDTAPATVADVRAVLDSLRETRGRMTPGEWATGETAHGKGYASVGPLVDVLHGSPLCLADAQGAGALVNAADALIAVAEAGLALRCNIEFTTRGHQWMCQCAACGWGRSYDAELAAVAALDRSAGA